MNAPREPESIVPVGVRPRRWWVRPLGLSAGAIYAGQLAPFLFGPLTECTHCVLNYLKFFPMIPGFLLGDLVMRWLPVSLPENDFFRFVIPGVLILALIGNSATLITAKTKGAGRWTWLLFLAALAVFNSLAFSMLLRS